MYRIISIYLCSSSVGAIYELTGKISESLLELAYSEGCDSGRELVEVKKDVYK